jgi:prevent-host-death family protein
MKTMTAREAKTHFGEFLDAMQREPVLVTKNNRPVGIMLSIQDAADTLIPEMFMDKASGYDEWFAARASERLASLHAGAATDEHDAVMARVQDRLNAQVRQR